MLVNLYNFLRWDDLAPAVSVESDLPNGYLRDRNRCDMKPLLIPSEAMRFYINAPNGLDFTPNPATQKLALVASINNAVVNADVAPLQVDTFNVTDQTFYAEVVIDITVPAGSYYFQIKQGATVLLQSNQIQVPIGIDYLQSTVLAQFRHDRSFYGVNYQNLIGFYQQFRLTINQIDDQFEGDKEVYNEVTTGKQRTFNNFMKQVVKVETYYFDKHAHDAAAILFDHDEIYLNLKRYVAKGTYKVNWDQLSKVFKGEIDLFVEAFASANRCTT